MPGMIGKKIGMTSLFDDNGKNLPCTVLEVSPNVVTQLKTEGRDGYNAVQLGYGQRREKSTSRALAGHFKKAKVEPCEKLHEFANDFGDMDLKPGVAISLEDFTQEGEFVDVSGTTKGKGFQGVVKRHGFHGAGEITHGQHGRERVPGAIGAGSDPSRVFKGMRMAGRTGGKPVMVENLQVLKLDAEKNIMVLKGSVPGPKNSLVTITK